MMDMPDARVQAKITGKEGLSFNGTALVYDCEEDMLEALENGGTGIFDIGLPRHHTGPTCMCDALFLSCASFSPAKVLFRNPTVCLRPFCRHPQGRRGWSRERWPGRGHHHPVCYPLLKMAFTLAPSLTPFRSLVFLIWCAFAPG